MATICIHGLLHITFANVTADSGDTTYGIYKLSSNKKTINAFVDWLCNHKDVKLANYGNALADFEAADSMGHMKAPRYLGLCYENGYGVKKDYKKAADYYQKAADRGDITGTCLLGHMYEEGLGVSKDYSMAMELYLKSAQRGDVIAAPGMVAVGRMYEAGYGVDIDLNTARKWYQKALEAGYEEAALELERVS